jgi:hypothetical protein
MLMASSPEQIRETTTKLRRAAAAVGVDLPKGYADAIAVEGLSRPGPLQVGRLGDGVVIHTASPSNDCRQVLLGYADHRGQWYRDGRRHLETPVMDDAVERLELGL